MLKSSDVMPGRRLVIGAAAGAMAAAPWVARAQAGFPNRPISMIIPFPPGGTTDVTLRALAEGASRHLQQQVVVDNRPGAANTLGAAMVARARPDGYLLTQMPASAIRVQLLQKLAYDTLKDFSPVLCVTGYTFMTIAKAGRFPRGWADFLAEAKRRPGELSYGSTGANGTPHVTMAELLAKEGINAIHVPFRGDADGSQALLGGHIDVMAGGSGLGTLVDGKAADFMHVWNAERLPRWPQAPTLRELGYDMVVTTPFGLVGPAGMDPGVTKVLHDAFAAAAKSDEFRAMLTRYDMPDEYRDSAAYGALLRETVAQEEALIRRLKLTAG